MSTEPRASDDVINCVCLLAKVMFMAKERRWPDLKEGASVMSLVCSRHEDAKTTYTWSWLLRN